MDHGARASPEQFAIMLEYMERNGDLNKIRYNGPLNRIKAEKHWLELTKRLNSVQGSRVRKSTLKWKKVWSDWKNNTKRKEYKINKEKQNAHNSSTGSRLKLTPQEEKLLKIAECSSTNSLDLTQDSQSDLEQALDTFGRTCSVGDSTASSNQEEFAAADDPLVQVKQEIHEIQWVPPPDDAESRDSDMAHVSPRSSSPPAGATLPLNSDDAFGQEGSKLDERRQEREEELHKLKVAEKIWMLKTLRVKHATAQLERERVQKEREWELKTLRERHAAAQLERERAQLERDRAQLQLDRAKHRDPDMYDI